MITTLRLQQFRNYADASYEFNDGVNIIIGPNGSGKTSLVEAVYMLHNGSSFKATDERVIKAGAEWSRIDATFLHNDVRYIKLWTERDTVHKLYGVSGQEKKRYSAQYSLPTVLFEPKDMNILTGDPAARRNFLDDILTRLHVQYGSVLKQYRRVLAQRNALLKTRQGSDLFVWDLRLSELGGVIHDHRQRYIQTVRDNIGMAYARISDKQDDIVPRLEDGIQANDYTGTLLRKLSESHQKDMERGFTGHGPHRDDVVFTIRGEDVRTTASRGEIRSVLLALRLVEVGEIEKVHNKKPLILLDDVFSELDTKRRHSLAAALTNYQTLITTTDADLVIEHFSGSAAMIAL